MGGGENNFYVQILIMLFTDDILLASYCSVAGLQKQINVLKHFADNFPMTVNVIKTNIIVFRKGGFVSANDVWMCGDEEV